MRQLEFPAASKARTVTVLAPLSSGIEADQEVVPLAVPLAPKLVAQVMLVTPLLSLAVPRSAKVAAAVVAVPVEGEVRVTVGAVLSPLFSAVRVMVKLFETLAPDAVAVTVTLLAPIARATFTDQAAAVPVATPEALPAVQVIAMAPVPPLAEPVSEIDAAVVVAAGAFTVKLNGAAVGLAEIGRAHV